MSPDEAEAVAAAEHVTTEHGWIEAARKVVINETFLVADGMVLDLFSASAMLQVHDALNPAHQARFTAMSLVKAHTITFKLLEKTR